MDKVFCWKCGELFELDALDTDEYHSFDEDEVFNVVRCPSCKQLNSLIWRMSIDFYAYRPTDEEIEMEGE